VIVAFQRNETRAFDFASQGLPFRERNCLIAARMKNQYGMANAAEHRANVDDDSPGQIKRRQDVAQNVHGFPRSTRSGVSVKSSGKSVILANRRPI
jgi:hypothetical protein